MDRREVRKMKKIIFTFLLMSVLYGQANSLLTLPPTAQISSLGNVDLPYMNPARYGMMKDNLSFSRVNWMSNITDDMFYTHFSVKRKMIKFSMLTFNYGEQLETNSNGVVIGDFTPASSIWGFSYNGVIKGYNYGLKAKLISHSLFSQKTLGTAFDISTYIPKVYKDLDLDVAIRNFGFAPTFNNYKTKLPTSLNLALSYPYKDFMFYEQHNFFKKNHTFGMGILYKYDTNDNTKIFGKMGYFSDKKHNLKYPTFGVDLKYEQYFIGISYIYGDRTLPLGDTFRLTINLEF